MRLRGLVLLVAVLMLGVSLGAPHAAAAKKAVKKPADVKAAQGAAPVATPPTKESAPVPTAPSRTEPVKKTAPVAVDSVVPKHSTFVINKTGATLWVQIKDTYLRTPIAPNGVHIVARGAEITLSANDGKTVLKKATGPEMKVQAGDLFAPVTTAGATETVAGWWHKFAKFTAAHNKTASE